MSILSRATGKEPELRSEIVVPELAQRPLWDSISPNLAEEVYFADQIEVFADFQKPDEALSNDSDFPVFAYGINLYGKTGERKTCIFESTSDGCLMSEIADERRSSSLNAVIFYLNRLLVSFPTGKSYQVTVKTGMKINGIVLPKNFYLA